MCLLTENGLTKNKKIIVKHYSDNVFFNYPKSYQKLKIARGILSRFVGVFGR